MNSTQKSSIGAALKYLLAVDLILSALVATRVSLLVALGGNFIGAGVGVTSTASVGTWFATFALWAIVQGFIGAIGGFIGIVVFGTLFKDVFFQDGGLSPISKLIGKGALGLAALGSGFGAFMQYGVLASHAVQANTGLNVVGSILTFVLGTLYGTIALSFIGAVATIILGTIFALFGGSKKA
ncbi:MAG TPA: hypothetical protein V6C97_33760 [Oculatellaceae cyanobacterium]